MESRQELHASFKSTHMKYQMQSGFWAMFQMFFARLTDFIAKKMQKYVYRPKKLLFHCCTTGLKMQIKYQVL